MKLSCLSLLLLHILCFSQALLRFDPSQDELLKLTVANGWTDASTQLFLADDAAPGTCVEPVKIVPSSSDASFYIYPRRADSFQGFLVAGLASPVLILGGGLIEGDMVLVSSSSACSTATQAFAPHALVAGDLIEGEGALVDLLLPSDYVVPGPLHLCYSLDAGTSYSELQQEDNTAHIDVVTSLIRWYTAVVPALGGQTVDLKLRGLNLDAAQVMVLPVLDDVGAPTVCSTYIASHTTAPTIYTTTGLSTVGIEDLASLSPPLTLPVPTDPVGVPALYQVCAQTSSTAPWRRVSDALQDPTASFLPLQVFAPGPTYFTAPPMPRVGESVPVMVFGLGLDAFAADAKLWTATDCSDDAPSAVSGVWSPANHAITFDVTFAGPAPTGPSPICFSATGWDPQTLMQQYGAPFQLVDDPHFMAAHGVCHTSVSLSLVGTVDPTTLFKLIPYDRPCATYGAPSTATASPYAFDLEGAGLYTACMGTVTTVLTVTTTAWKRIAVVPSDPLDAPYLRVVCPAIQTVYVPAPFWEGSTPIDVLMTGSDITATDLVELVHKLSVGLDCADANPIVSPTTIGAPDTDGIFTLHVTAALPLGWIGVCYKPAGANTWQPITPTIEAKAAGLNEYSVKFPFVADSTVMLGGALLVQGRDLSSFTFTFGANQACDGTTVNAAGSPVAPVGPYEQLELIPGSRMDPALGPWVLCKDDVVVPGDSITVSPVPVVTRVVLPHAIYGPDAITPAMVFGVGLTGAELFLSHEGVCDDVNHDGEAAVVVTTGAYTWQPAGGWPAQGTFSICYKPAAELLTLPVAVADSLTYLPRFADTLPGWHVVSIPTVNLAMGNYSVCSGVAFPELDLIMSASTVIPGRTCVDGPCKACLPGQFGAYAGANVEISACSVCPKDTYSSSSGSSTCSPCPAGTHAPPASNSAEDCS